MTGVRKNDWAEDKTIRREKNWQWCNALSFDLTSTLSSPYHFFPLLLRPLSGSVPGLTSVEAPGHPRLLAAVVVTSPSDSGVSSSAGFRVHFAFVTRRHERCGALARFSGDAHCARASRHRTITWRGTALFYCLLSPPPPLPRGLSFSRPSSPAWENQALVHSRAAMFHD